MECGMFFKLPWFGKKTQESYHDTQVLELDFIVDEFHDAMADIKDPVRTRLQASLMMCESPKDLWFLRSKLFALISKHHCESIAHTRVSLVVNSRMRCSMWFQTWTKRHYSENLGGWWMQNWYISAVFHPRLSIPSNTL
jgi:hypothetical protein